MQIFGANRILTKDPLTMLSFPSRPRRLASALSAVLAPALITNEAVAQQLEEVVVTATKRSASTQDIAVTVSAVSGEKLEQLGVQNFEDYLIQLPGVTAGGSGPGQNTIYIRGVASTTPNLSTAGVAGLAPNVAFYLDEQPLAQPGRNLDIYAADLQRVEVLAGPQGTLFGASSQSGTVRMITNKPDFTETYGKIKAEASTMKDGEASYNGEAVFNWAVNERFAMRAVVYRDDMGGYIDNVPGTIDQRESARFRPAGTVRSNGVPVSDARGGFQAGADLSNVDFRAADNSDLVEDDFNDATYTGGRISASFDITPTWNLLVAHTQQELETEGVFYADPSLGEMEIRSYEESFLEDDLQNTAWTLTGAINELELVYTGAFTKREVSSRIDYTDYLYVSQYIPYYLCDTEVSYPAYNPTPTGTCYAPNLFTTMDSELEIQTHEFRVSTDATKPIRATVGVFYSELDLEERVDFSYPSNVFPTLYGNPGDAFPENFSYPDGFLSTNDPFPEAAVFRNDILRTDEQLGFFGEVTFDIGNEFAVIVGARRYEVTSDLDGSANGSFGNPFYQIDCQRGGTNISDLYDGDGVYRDTAVFLCRDDQPVYTLADLDNPDVEVPDYVRGALLAPGESENNGTIYKLTGQWTPNADMLFYATYSEGFRPGILNRPGGQTNPSGEYTVPYGVGSDELKNYELGWKTDLMGGTLRFNGALFQSEISGLQTTIFDTSIVNLFFSDNAADSEVRGLEGDITWLPKVAGLTISGAFSFLDTEITEVLVPTDDVRAGDTMAFAPEFQGTLTARYEWPMGDYTAHVMGNVSYSDESYSDIIRINRDKIDSWTMMGVTAGLRADDWSATAFVDNLTDERAELSRNYVNDRGRATYARPRTMGLRVSYNF
ncbi:TonB-dependent receptor [Luminiphilus syltensis NOR5-1B]|uniref:TonB-dependent receptor n=1 Tax=Luminiphilus syltensis NOR5-1B TaxID=565045 RepID=B8KTL4_9GAMM|nr:TonB-dependent receptor [Luminiphilus syltensis]EED35649.1 TonB-dependent receptor [Luminiphilus syltensis NOR5-1B]